ncbi:phosphatidate cytidylyltransferase [Crenobacter cavernae]|uniref:Phosphatidate cytidylyltransferase n=1 Tax=Crenobacter cavernae TaxID=2290923 RepID=A0ABY0FCN0_9NEIS|nr:phosphatidate cytidylyltransferase [Crenobacter cavernae]RXZ42084.1 phosphatidate cytidylyltransferase [Crenobacter cavernae]
MLKTRILTALVLLPLMLAALFAFPPAAWAAFCALVVGLALWEYTRMVAMPRAVQVVYLTASALVFAACWLSGWRPGLWMHGVALAVWLILAPLWLARRWALKDGWPARALGWALMLPAWFAFLDWRPDPQPSHAFALLAVMGLVWVADIAAYFSGRAFGRHKLAPAISPGKSWEGVAGALVAVTLYAFFVSSQGWLGQPWPLVALVPVALALTAVSVVGDLLESWFKRAAGIKDSSALLPGHGGVYDRIDSLIAVLAVSNALRVLAGG